MIEALSKILGKTSVPKGRQYFIFIPTLYSLFPQMLPNLLLQFHLLHPTEKLHKLLSYMYVLFVLGTAEIEFFFVMAIAWDQQSQGINMMRNTGPLLHMQQHQKLRNIFQQMNFFSKPMQKACHNQAKYEFICHLQPVFVTETYNRLHSVSQYIQ